MKRIFLDTNFLMIPGDIGVDIFSEIRRITDFSYYLFVVDKTMDELKKLTKEGKGKHKRAAKLGLQLIKAKDIAILKSTSNLNTDQLLVEVSVPGQDIVATQDAELKRLLRQKGIDIIILRKKKYLNIIKT